MVTEVCPFPVLLHDVVNTGVITDFFDQDGNLVMRTFTGRLVAKLSRLDAQGNPLETISRTSRVQACRRSMRVGPR